MDTVLHWKGNWARTWADSIYKVDQHQGAGYGQMNRQWGPRAGTLRSQHPLQQEPTEVLR